MKSGESTLRMMTFDPVVPGRGVRAPGMPPGSPLTCADRSWERSRLEWRLGDPGDPADLVAGFLAEHGLGSLMIGPDHDPAAPGVCGAAVLISAAAGARMAGGPPGAPSPAPAVPDVVVVVYEHRGSASASLDAGPGARKAPSSLVAPVAWLPALLGPGDAGPGAWQLGAWRASWTAEEHAAAVSSVRDAIARGDVYQVNVVGHASAPYAGDPGPALRRATRLAGARYAGVLAGGGWALACASPETLVEVRAGRVVTRPIKGTRPATEAGRAELFGSAKERAEHIMIVDLERNDLARVAATGSVRVDELYAIRRWCDLWQAESVVSARLADGIELADLLRAVCPGGSVTGAPKLAALAEIAAREPVGRGPSMGALGWVGRDHVDLGLTIRTVAADAQRLHVWAGGGITWDSDPQDEVAEAAAKAAPLRQRLRGRRRSRPAAPG